MLLSESITSTYDIIIKVLALFYWIWIWNTMYLELQVSHCLVMGFKGLI